MTNHINTVHAIAMANACEMAAGVLMEASLSRTMRWIPRGMQIDYQKKAQGGIYADARCEPVVEGSTGDAIVHCTVTDEQQQIVVVATINMYVSPRKT